MFRFNINIGFRFSRSCQVILTVAGLALLLSACSRDETADEAATTTQQNAPTETALPRTASPPGARVFFANLADGDVVSNPVTIQFGIDGMSVAKAGVADPQSGHHHLLIDAPLPDMSLPIPASDNYVHFGDASRSTERTFTPGKHTLQMLLGDHLHIPHDPPVMSDVITIEVR